MKIKKVVRSLFTLLLREQVVAVEPQHSRIQDNMPINPSSIKVIMK